MKQIVKQSAVFSSLAIAALSVGVMWLLFRFLPNDYAMIMGLNVGMGFFYLALMYLDILPHWVNRQRIIYAIAQLTMISLFSPWIGWTTSNVNSWYGRYFALVYFIFPWLYEIGAASLRSLGLKNSMSGE